MESKKKTLVLAGIGLAFLLVLVIGATYAYFTFASQNDFKDPATIEGSMGELGAGVSLTRAEDSTLTLNLSAADMLLESAQTYYASGSETPKTIATVKVAGGGIFNCTYTLEVTKTSKAPETDMYNRFQSSEYTNKGEGQIYFTVNDTTYDFNTANLFDANGKLTYSGTLSMISNAEDIELTANMVIVNLSDKDQTYLNGTDVSISINATTFDCELIDTNTKATVEGIEYAGVGTDSITVEVNATDTYGIDSYTFQINDGEEITQEENTYTFENLEMDTEYEITTYVTNTLGNTSEPVTETMSTAPSNLGEALEFMADKGEVDNVGDAGYRYQGAEVNNYVTFNGETWRIIGSVDGSTIGLTAGSNYTKIIRDVSIGNLAYDTDNDHGNDWSTTSLYTLLNGDYYNRVNDYAETGLTEDAKALIVDANWYYAPKNTSSQIASVWYTNERSDETKVVKSAVGIMYPSDYGYAAPTAECGSTYLNSYNSGCYEKDWLYKSGTNQWTIIPVSSYASFAWHVRSSGYVYYGSDVARAYAVRPSVYLDTDIIITGGNGSSLTPFIIAKSTN